MEQKLNDQTLLDILKQRILDLAIDLVKHSRKCSFFKYVFYGFNLNEYLIIRKSLCIEYKKCS